LKTFAIAVLAAAALAPPTPSIADINPSGSAAKPVSLVPHAHTNQHVYGTPIGPAIVGRSKAVHRAKPAHRKPGPSRTTT